MPYALVVIGLVMIVTGINNTYSQLGKQLQTDLTGSGSQKGFIVWALALFAVGALGYVQQLRTFSHYFMALILISVFLSNKGFFQSFQAALASGPKAPSAPQTSALSSSAAPSQTPSQGVQSGSGGVGVDWLSSITKLFGSGATP